MAVDAHTATSLSPIMAFALVGALGVGSQWLAWRLRMQAIVLMLVAGIVVGPVLGVLDPSAQFGPMLAPMVAIAVAIILFEGGLTLNLHSLSDASEGVRRLVFVGAPLGWITSTLALHYGAGLGWEASTVFGGIMIVTGPTVIAPLLRSARLSRRPAALLQWEAIINDPIGALCAVLAFSVVSVLHAEAEAGEATLHMLFGIVFAFVIGAAGGYGLARAFKGGLVPEYMKVPVLFALLLVVFAVADTVLHESGLLAVTVMGVILANQNLPAYEELRRFKEHATVLLVSGVFILLAANLDLASLGALNWRAVLFVVLVIAVARPLTVLLSLAGTDVPIKERLLVALTGPRGVVLVAVAGLFGERLAQIGVDDGALVGPLAFVLVAVSVVLHGFTLAPMARALGLVGAETPGLLIVGGSAWTTALAEALRDKTEMPVVLTDPNHGHLRAARAAGFETFTGDVLSVAAEHRIELVRFGTALLATDNDAYNTLVATDLAHEMGREAVFQVTREKSSSLRHQLPSTLGGKSLGEDATYDVLNGLIFKGWTVKLTTLSEEFTMEDWRATYPEARLTGLLSAGQKLKFLSSEDALKPAPGITLIALVPPQAETPRG